MGIVVLSSWLLFAWLPAGGLETYQNIEPTEYVVSGSYFGEIGGEIGISDLFVGSTLRVSMWGCDIGFWPTQLQSTFKIGLRRESFEIGWNHTCSHPIIPFVGEAQWRGDEIYPAYDSAYDAIYIRIGDGRE